MKLFLGLLIMLLLAGCRTETVPQLPAQYSPTPPTPVGLMPGDAKKAFDSPEGLSAMLEKRWPLYAIQRFCIPDRRHDNMFQNLVAYGVVWEGTLYNGQQTGFEKIAWYATTKEGRADIYSLGATRGDDFWLLEINSEEYVKYPPHYEPARRVEDLLAARSNGDHKMKCLSILRTAILVSLSLYVSSVLAQSQFPSDMPSTSNGETSELRLYGRATQIGTVALRTIRNRSGKIVREVYYHSHALETSSLTEKDLLVQSIRVFYHDVNGRVERVEHWTPHHATPRLEQNAYSESGELVRKWYVEPDGIRRYEMRYRGSRELTHLYFDDTGAYLTSLRGTVVSDVTLPHGWGDVNGGVACAITLSKESGRLEDIGIWVTIRNATDETLHIFNLSEPSFELRDSAGKLILPRVSQRGLDENQSHLNGQVLDCDEAGFMYPAYRLVDYFGSVLPGKYTIRIRQAVKERSVELVSNDVTFVVR
jgi:hypothetical protein